MPPANRELVDGELPQAVQVILGGAQPQGEGPLVDLLDRIPAHAKPRRHLLDGKYLREAGDLLGQTGRHALIPIEPRHRLHRRATARTLKARARHDQPRIPLAQRQVAHPALAYVVNLLDDGPH